jgi:hypothetical protein
MKKNSLILIVLNIVLFSSCSVIEKSSRHGFESGYYELTSDSIKAQNVYLDVTQDKITAFPAVDGCLQNKEILTVSLLNSDNLYHNPVKFTKKSLDIDITTILFKYRPGTYGLPAQLNTDFNAAIYSGWRRDNFYVRSKIDPLNNCHNELINRGFDFGIFAGPGTILIGPFSTRNAVINEYNAAILQFGVAGFIESNIASFGIATGFDYLLSPDRNIWIYNHKPWIGFIVGIALD